MNSAFSTQRVKGHFPENDATGDQKQHPGATGKQNFPVYDKPGDKVSRFAVQDRILASKLTSSAKVLLLAILKHAFYGASERGCFASNETMAGETDLSARQVGRLILELEKAGWIKIERTGESKHAYKTIHPTAACLGIETTSEVGHPRLSADDAPRHPGHAPRHPGQEDDPGCPTRIELKEREKEEFAGGVFSPGKEDEDEPGPRILPFPTGPASDAAAIAPKPKPMPGPPRPWPPVMMQNYNPPTPIEPDPDPVRTAAAVAALRRQFPDLQPPREQPHEQAIGHRECEGDRRIPRGEAAGDRPGNP